MASSKEYLEFVLGQLSDLEEITYRSMMGEFIIYYHGEIVGGIYDDRLLVKPVKSAISYMPTASYELPYDGAKEVCFTLCMMNYQHRSRKRKDKLFSAIENRSEMSRQIKQKLEDSVMRKVNLFIAMSLDGYIADSEGGVDWLGGQGEESEDVDVYSAFIKDIDTVLMGWKTYHQIVTELSPEEWIYHNLKTYVFTHKEHKSTKNVQFIDRDPADLITSLREKDGRDIWICGGANLIQQMVKEDLIDCYYITIIPTILGSGIRLFDNLAGRELKLKLIKTQTYNGMTDLVYVRR